MVDISQLSVAIRLCPFGEHVVSIYVSNLEFTNELILSSDKINWFYDLAICTLRT